MKEYKYILEPYTGMRSRHTCPQCGEKKRFTRYINTDTKEYISDKVGRCDRENTCNYHYTPSSFFSDNPNHCNVTCETDATRSTNGTRVTDVTVVTEPLQFIPFEVMDKSVTAHTRSNLYPFLKKLFTNQIASKLCLDYFIGSNKDGNTVFWQVDINNNVRQAKVMQYDPLTGKRNKATGAFFAGKENS